MRRLHKFGDTELYRWDPVLNVDTYAAKEDLGVLQGFAGHPVYVANTPVVETNRKSLHTHWIEIVHLLVTQCFVVEHVPKLTSSCRRFRASLLAFSLPQDDYPAVSALSMMRCKSVAEVVARFFLDTLYFRHCPNRNGDCLTNLTLVKLGFSSERYKW